MNVRLLANIHWTAMNIGELGRIWSTFKASSSTAVKHAIHQLTTIASDKLQVKRKFKTSHNNNVIRWWHVISGEEAVLVQLEQEWEKVKLQTNWKIEPCLINASEDFLDRFRRT